ncbi:MAG: hypothetical protein ABI639_15915, partial [Thermoanaerobaculia bacterium]
PVAPAVVDAGSDVAICAGASVQIGTAAIGGQNYSWSPGGATTAQITVSPSVQTIYTVTAVNNCANASDSVTVSITPGADAPALVAPADGAINQALPVALSWAPVAGATTYTLEVATDAAFASIVHSETIGGTSTSVAGLDPIEYFWRVRATNVCIGAPSATRTFTVTDVLFTDGFESGGTSAWSVFP